MKPPCADCPHNNQTIHTIELNDEEFEMLKWVINSERNLYNSIVKDCSSKDIENGCYAFAVILLWLNNLDKIVKNS